MSKRSEVQRFRGSKVQPRTQNLEPISLGRTQMTRILRIFTDFILFYLYLCRSVLICVIRVPLNAEPRTVDLIRPRGFDG